MMRVTLVQAPLNLLDQRLLRSGVAGTIEDPQGCEIHVRSAFLQGLLLGLIGRCRIIFSAMPLRLTG